MKSLKTTSHIITVIIAFTGAGAFAQDDDFIIIEDGATTGDAGGGASFSGEVLGSYFGGGDITRSNGGVKVRYFQEFNDTVSAVVEGRGQSSNVDLEFERKDVGSDEVNETFTHSVSTNKAELNEGYLRVNRGVADFYLGRRKQVLGQFDVFSPVDFVLPVDLSSSEVSFTKLDRKYPQTVASLYLYPTPKWELQLQYFPLLERDPVTRALLEESDGFPYMEPESTDQYLARLVYTGEKFTAGVTYYDGFALYPEVQQQFTVGADTMTNEPTVTGGNNTYPEFTGYGFEIAVPVKRALFKYELMVGQRFHRFDECLSVRDFEARCNAFADFIRNKFDGNFFVNSDAGIQAIGFDYLGDDWTINFALFSILDLASADEKRARELSDDASGSDTSNAAEGFAPSFNFARHHGDNRALTTGFAGGFFGNTFGASAYHIRKPTDNWSIIIALEALSYQSDVQTEDQVDDEQMPENGTPQTAELTTATAAGIRLGFTYKF